ncbi:MAG: hypothetical protein ABI882_22085, partial [Acidobacteriota bacterium]
MKGRLCLVVAAEVEYRAAANVLKRLPQHDVVLIKSGIGAVGFESVFADRLASADIGRVIMTGLCGALSEDLRKGDIVLYDRCRNLTDEIELDRELSAKLASTFTPVRGTGLTVTRVVAEASEKKRLRAEYGALAVDMETFIVASACKEQGVPVAALRVVSDEADEDLPDFNRALSDHGEMIARRVPGVL